MRARTKFGRCRVQGHGSNCTCEIIVEIQSAEVSRTTEKKKWRDDMMRDYGSYTVPERYRKAG